MPGSMMPAQISVFAIQRELGRGGMGVVYLALDNRLDREVAIKALPARLADDHDRLARFEREAKVLASLNHPNIAAIYGLEKVDGNQYIVMEYVEGQSLADRLKLGPLPVDEALVIARQIAEALETAHEKGVIHRDIKPGNVMLRTDGAVKVLDFGLASASAGMDTSATEGVSPHSPTGTWHAPAQSPTILGAIMGTAGYMSPEQARGKIVDKRSDIFSYGCVLYEMLTGIKPFQGDTVADAIGATLHQQLDMSQLPTDTPWAVRQVLQRCLVKDKQKRLRDIGDARLELESSSTINDTPQTSTRGTVVRWVWAAAIALLTLGVGTITGYWVGGHTPIPLMTEVTRLEMVLEPAEMLGPVLESKRPFQPSFVLTTDGRRVIFTGTVKNMTQLYLRSLDSTEAIPLTGTTGAHSPFLSPDGVWVGFYAEGEIRKTPVAGGPIVKIARLTDGGLASPSSLVPAENDFFGATWGADDVIYFGRFAEGLWYVPAAGGTPKRLASVKSGEQRLPHMLPQNRGLLVTLGQNNSISIGVISPPGGNVKTIIENGSDARFVDPNHLVFARDGVLMVAPFDLVKLEIIAPPVALVSNLLQSVRGSRPATNVGTAFFDVTSSGTLVFATGGVYRVEPTQLVWVDRKGMSEPLGMPSGYMARPRLAPDGRRLVVSYAPASGYSGDSSPHIFDLERGTITRLMERELGWGPLWSRDGSRIFFTGFSKSGNAAIEGGLSSILADGTSPLVKITNEDQRLMASCELPDKSQIVGIAGSEKNGNDIVLVSPQGEVRPWLDTKANESWAEISPDGKHMAYGSDVSGQHEVYVQPFPGPGPRQQVSINGGIAPLWSRSGKELFFANRIRKDGLRLTEINLVNVTSGTQLSFGKPKLLFTGRYGTLGGLTDYDISIDDKRFLMIEQLPVLEQPITRLHVILNWTEALHRLKTTGAR